MRWSLDLATDVWRTLLHRSTGTRIGEGLRERGHLDEAAIERTLNAIAEHAAAIREHTSAFRIIATSALRRADNEREFVRTCRALTGARIHIISGEEEAACSYAGALSGIRREPACEASASSTSGAADRNMRLDENAVRIARYRARLAPCA